MRRRPAATAAALSILSVGLAATTAVFTVVQAVLVQPLPYPAAHRLVSIWGTFPEWRQQPALSAQWDRVALSYQEYSRVVSGTRSLDGVGAAWFRTARVQEPDGTLTEVPIARGSVSLLGLLGMTPVTGRWFLPGEEGPGAPHVAVLPNGLWRTKYGADERIAGRTIVIENEPFEIVGVLPASFHFGSVGPFARWNDDQAIWLPIGSGSSDLVENSQNYEVIARLAPGVTLERAADEIRPIVLDNRDPAKRGARVEPRLEAETGAARVPLLTLFLAAILLLSITCATLAALLIGEASRRVAEIRTRLALGAKPARLVRQLLTESLLLASIGAAVAVPVAVALVRGLLSVSPDRLPRQSAIGIGWPTLAFAAAAAIVTGALFGLAPAWTLRRGAAGLAIGDRTGTIARTRLQRSMVAVEAALSIVLLVAAGLLLRSLANERQVQPGYRTDHLLAVSVAAPASADRRLRSALPFFVDAMDALRALPGVEWVTATTDVPLGGNDGQWAVSPDPAGKLSISSPNAQHDAVAPGYFQTMGLRIVEGRALDERDAADNARVAVVNETMARSLWPGRSPVGLQFLAPNGGVRTIVGVAADIHDRGLAIPARSTFYESIRQLGPSRLTMVIRVAGSPEAIAPLARAAVGGVNRGALVERVVTLDELVADSMRTQRYRALLLQFFALAALAVTAIGVGGVAIHAAVLRRRELWVRMAVGATPASVRRLVLRQSAAGLAIGVVAGGAAAAAIMRVASSYFFALSWYDPVTYLAAAAALIGAASLAGWLALGRVTPTDLSRELAGW